MPLAGNQCHWQATSATGSATGRHWARPGFGGSHRHRVLPDPMGAFGFHHGAFTIVTNAPLAWPGAADTIGPLDPPIMATASATASPRPVSGGQPVSRLAGQLQSLTELTESLAFRLLELEERLAAQELRIQSLLDNQVQGAGLCPDTDLRLDDTEERLARLEMVLSGLEGSVAVRQGAGVLALPRPEVHSDDGAAGETAADPFYEEGEQPFMDEQLVDPYAVEACAGADGDRLERLSA